MNYISTSILLLSFLFPIFLTAQDALNVELFDQIQREDERYSGSWSYIAADGSEYALLGAKDGTAIYSIDNQPVTELAYIPGASSNWREITVVNGFAYVTTEANAADGMHIIDLRSLPDTATLAAVYDSTFVQAHILQSDIYSDSSYIFVNGTRTTGGVHILDVSNPTHPVEVGVYDPDYYIHDSHIRGDRLYACAGNQGVVDIVDISDKKNPTLITQITGLVGYVHSAWSIDDDYLMVAVETDGLPARMYDIRDLDNIEEVARYTANTASLVHNPYLRGDFMFIPHNTEGLRVVDVADPRVPVEVGYYDTFAGESGGFAGLWSACPYFPSGKIIGGNRTDGLYVWTFNDTRAARIYGTVRDSLTGEIIPRAQLNLIEADLDFKADLVGEFAQGTFAGDYILEISHDDYFTKQIPLSLAQGDNLTLNIELVNLLNNTDEVIDNQSFSVNPNPFSNELILDDLDTKVIEKVQLVDINGRIVMTKNVVTGSIVLSTNTLPKGIYFVQSYDKNDLLFKSHKVIKE